MKQVTMFEMMYSELEALAKKHYGMLEYSFVATEECGNDCSSTFNVSAEEMNPPDKEDWSNALGSKGASLKYNNYLVLDALAGDKHIPEGKYLIRVSW